MEVKADLGHQRPAGRPPPRRVAVAGANANACETACNGVLRPGLRLTATRVPWCRRHPLWRGDLTALPEDLKARIKWNAEAVWGQGLGMGWSGGINLPCVADVWEGARRNHCKTYNLKPKA